MFTKRWTDKKLIRLLFQKQPPSCALRRSADGPGAHGATRNLRKLWLTHARLNVACTRIDRRRLPPPYVFNIAAELKMARVGAARYYRFQYGSNPRRYDSIHIVEKKCTVLPSLHMLLHFTAFRKLQVAPFHALVHQDRYDVGSTGIRSHRHHCSEEKGRHLMLATLGSWRRCASANQATPITIFTARY